MRKNNIISVVLILVITVGLVVAARFYFPPGGKDIVMIVKRTVVVDGEKNDRLSYSFYINKSGEYYYANGYDFDRLYSRFSSVKDSEFEAFLNDEFFSWKYDKMLEGPYVSKLDASSYLRTIDTLEEDDEKVTMELDKFYNHLDYADVTYEVKVRSDASESFITIALFENNQSDSFTGTVFANPNAQKIVKNLLQKWPIKTENGPELESIIQSLEG